MSEHDITRPFVTETGVYNDGKAVAVSGTGHSTKTEIDNSYGKRTNDTSSIVAWVACIMSSIALGVSIAVAVMSPSFLDARAESISAIVDARLAALPEIIDARATEKAARAIALAEIAEREARIAQDDVGLMRIEQAKLGIVTPNDH
jgi:hypothetical protein